ncbi:hypothetical protein OS127_02995 [Corynebacterium sp. P6129]|uniref:hypothetical protein n=1 Tax=Corynebacterium antarcticum TaxID=2800405 RepID=UPI00226093E4|nr:hypothetical protein [Corynebacterium antarcticum]MCX7491495.1 hypothetical protein [Corynebacterium antarcticum]
MTTNLTGIRGLIRAKHRAQKLTLWGHTALAVAAGFPTGVIAAGGTNLHALTIAAAVALAGLCTAAAFYSRAAAIEAAMKHHPAGSARR